MKAKVDAGGGFWQVSCLVPSWGWHRQVSLFWVYLWSNPMLHGKFLPASPKILLGSTPEPRAAASHDREQESSPHTWISPWDEAAGFFSHLK